MYEKTFPHKRYQKTIQFLESHIPKEDRILDLGVKNPLSAILEGRGYQVKNTGGEDLDIDFSAVQQTDAEVVTAFEIFEHLLAPFNVLRNIRSEKLVASVPLRLWFSPAYKSDSDPWDRHYHEFEEWQFDWLLEKSGWKIESRTKWCHPVNRIGIRPFLRLFTPRYYMVYATRSKTV